MTFDNNIVSRRAAEARLRRAARRLGCYLAKSRRRLGSLDNQGRFQVTEKSRNTIVAGERFDLDHKEVALYFADVAGEVRLQDLARNMRELAKAKIAE